MRKNEAAVASVILLAGLPAIALAGAPSIDPGPIRVGYAQDLQGGNPPPTEETGPNRNFDEDREDDGLRDGRGWTVRVGFFGVSTDDEADTNSAVSPSPIDFDSGGGLTVAGGYDFGPLLGEQGSVALGLRIEAELNFWNMEADNLPAAAPTFTRTEPFFDRDGDLSGADFTLNAIADLDLTNHFSLYGGAGGGWSAMVLGDDFNDDNDTFGLFQWTAGAEIRVHEGVRIYGQYRQKYYYGDGTFFEIDFDDPQFDVVEVGVRFTF